MYKDAFTHPYATQWALVLLAPNLKWPVQKRGRRLDSLAPFCSAAVSFEYGTLLSRLYQLKKKERKNPEMKRGKARAGTWAVI